MECLWLHFILCVQVELACGIEFSQQQRLASKLGQAKAKDWAAPPASTAAAALDAADKTDQESSDAALAFLYSPDPQRLSQVNCTRRFELKEPDGKQSPSLQAFTRSAVDTVVHATNFLNLIFQTNDIRESSVKEDIEWYHALVRSIAEGDPKIFRAVLAFDAHPLSSSVPQLMLQATREKNEIILQDISASGDYLRNLTTESKWFTSLKFQSPFLQKRILNNDLKTLETPKWNRGDSYVMNETHIKWSAPFLECDSNKFVPGWMITLSSSFFGLKPNLSPEFKGVVRIDVNLQSLDIDQCFTGDAWFANSHQCELNSTQCVPVKGQGFRLGSYYCICKTGFYNSSPSGSDKEILVSPGPYGVEDGGMSPECRPCPQGCSTCVDNTPCMVKEDWYLRAAVLAFQAFCMLLVFISMLASYHFRRSKRIRASGLLLLETILFGSLLLYFPVFILYFKPSIFRCILLRWVRLLGFGIVNGTITLKLYRVLKVFLSRSAQRVPFMTSLHVLKMLAVILVMVSWFLAAWTVGMLENIEKNIPLVVQSQTPGGLRFSTCDLDRWDHMMALAEFLFLCWGSFLCYAARTVPSAFHEPRYIGIALHNEMIVSAAFHAVRFVMGPSLHPDWLLLLFFAHTHVTITVTLALLFIPKFLHVGAPLREEITAEVYEEELDMRRSGSYLNSSIASAWSEHSLDPDDIKDELKKLYTQLEVHKTKKMTANNPHLQKKRSSRRGLGRSIMRRITEIPESMTRPYSREDKDGSLGSCGSYQGSYRKKVVDTASTSLRVKEDSFKHKVFSLRKSHSTYDHVRDHRENSPHRFEHVGKDTSLLDSLMRRKLAKKASDKSDSDSIDAAPLVCKSASAHNLSVDKKLLPQKPSTLQKSLSVITSAKERAIMPTKKTCSVEDNSKQTSAKEVTITSDGSNSNETQPEGSKGSVVMSEATKNETTSENPPGGMSSILKGSFDQAEVCPWELQDLPPPSLENKVQKHVTYAPMKCGSVDSSHLLGKPHEFNKKRLPEQPVIFQSLKQEIVDRSEISPGDTQEQLHPKCKSKPSKDLLLGAESSSEAKKLTDSSRLEDVCPWECESLQEGTEKVKMPDKSNQGVAALGGGHDGPFRDGKEHLPSSNCIPATTSAADIHPQDHEPQKDCSPDKSERATYTRSSSVYTAGPKPPAIDTNKSKSFKVPSNKSSTKGFRLSVIAMGVLGKGKNSIKERTAEERSNLSDKKATQKEKSKETWARARAATVKPQTIDIYPWEIEVVPSSATKQDSGTKGMGKELQQSESKLSEVCPWEAGSFESSTDTIAKVCPWEVSEASPSKAVKTDNQIAAVCPWEAEDAAPSQTVKSNISTEVCPWDAQGTFPNKTVKSNTSIEAVCPRDVEGTASNKKIKSNISVEVSPWEAEDAAPGKSIKPSANVEDVCPWDVDNAVPSKAIKPNASAEDVCPWDVDKAVPSKAINPNASAEDVCPKAIKPNTGVENVCPWEAEDAAPSKAIKPNTGVENVCPWDVDNAVPSKAIKPNASVENVCPWEAEEAAPSKAIKPSAGVENMCPWKVQEFTPRKLLTKQKALDSSDRDETKYSTKKLGKVDIKVAEVCPWEADEPISTIKRAAKDDNKQDAICSQESKETKLAETESREAIRTAEVCPWEMGEVTPSKTEKDNREMVHPRNTEDTKLRKPEKQPNKCDTTGLWGSREAKAPFTGKPERVESKVAAVCPWEADQWDTEVQKTDHADSKLVVCPWEAGEPTTANADSKKVSLEAEGTPQQAREQEPGKSENNQAQKATDDSNSTTSKNPSSICPWDFE
nr:PREDICTED: probable G-protein coupled receptor 179 [Latimeria chalumnae]|eukprot:XP_005990138.1 PREDICTED: probable G-protein coupled receptor 179 [Latimeria chalumnae]